MIKRGNIQSEMSQYQVIRLLRTRGSITRPDLVRITGLSRPTIDKIVDSFKKDRIISETGTRDGSSRGGRRPVVLTLDGSSKVIVGVDFECPGLEVIMTDLGSSIIDRRQHHYDATLKADHIIDTVIEDIREMLFANGRSTAELLGVGVALPGVVDVKTGVSLNIERLKNWNNVPVSQLLEQALSVQVFIDNDVNLMALAEKSLGKSDDSINLLYVAERQGIGAGIIIGGQIYRGTYGNSGFLGHTSIDPNGPKCRCGNYGCLELYAGESAIVALYEERIKLRRTSPKNSISHLNGASIYAAAAAGDPAAVAVLDEVATILGVGIANMICVLDINHVVLGGDVTKAGESFIAAVRNSVTRRLEPAFRRDMRFRFSTVNEHAAALGATLLVLEDVFGAPELEVLS